MNVQTPPATEDNKVLETNSPLGTVHAEIERLAKLAAGPVGVAALHLESGVRINVNGGERFPMASTCKIAIAIQILKLIEKNDLALEQVIEVKPGDLHPGSGTLSELFIRRGVALSIHNLLELTMRVSDNSATDILLNIAGGPDAVNQMLCRNGIDGMSVDRPLLDVLVERNGVPPQQKHFAWIGDAYDKMLAGVDPQVRDAARARFETDPRDTATPASMVELIAKLRRRELLTSGNTELLVELLARCKTGEHRLKGMLPPETPVAHKTGTFNKVLIADAGIITLPYGLGDVVIATFVRRTENEVAERIIAQSARAIYDFFLYQSGSSAKPSW
ncbi:MAG TPA: serine hydrolase [Planctomycetota bacterium]|nr:serine hydrolase [Planctomycetota bacterium]